MAVPLDLNSDPSYWVNWVRKKESAVHRWRGLLAGVARLWSLEVRYESLLGPHKGKTLHVTRSFLQAAAHKYVNEHGGSTQGSLEHTPISVRVHEATCAKRIANWDKHKDLFVGTETLHVCDILDKHLGARYAV